MRHYTYVPLKLFIKCTTEYETKGVWQDRHVTRKLKEHHPAW